MRIWISIALTLISASGAWTCSRANAPGPNAGAEAQTASTSGESVGIPPSPDGGFGPVTVGFCECWGSCASDVLCVHHHSIHCYVDNVSDSAKCTPTTGCKNVWNKKCEKHCDLTVGGKWVTELASDYDKPCIYRSAEE